MNNRAFATWCFAGVAFAALVYSGAAFSQDARAMIEVRVGAADGGCVMVTSRPAMLARWRAFQDGAVWISKKGPWGPQARFGCAAVGISNATRTQADYILWDTDLGPSVCMPAAGACP